MYDFYFLSVKGYCNPYDGDWYLNFQIVKTLKR